MPAPRKIGTITLRSAKQYQTTEQTACNYRLIDVPAGATADLMLHNDYGRHTWITWTFQGICIKSHFVNRVFTSSSVAEDRESGKPMGYTSQVYPYSLLDVMLNPAYTVVLDDGVEVTAEVKNLGSGRHVHTAVFARIALAG